LIPTFHLRQATPIFGIALFLCTLCAPVSANSALSLSLPATQQTERLVSGNAQKEQCAANKANCCETADETLWMGRFAHCDYGFYVLLPGKFVGHGNISPNPIHGFLVGLSDRSTTSPVRIADERFVWVNAEYNSLELKSLEDARKSFLLVTKFCSTASPPVDSRLNMAARRQND
jgi:hypothetical protein